MRTARQILAEIRADDAVLAVDIAVVRRKRQRIDRLQRQRQLDPFCPRPRDIGIGEGAEVEIDLVFRIAVEIGRRRDRAARQKRLFDPRIVIARGFGLERPRAVGAEQLVQRRRLEPFAVTGAQRRPRRQRQRGVRADRRVVAERVVIVVADPAGDRQRRDRGDDRLPIETGDAGIGKGRPVVEPCYSPAPPRRRSAAATAPASRPDSYSVRSARAR